MKSKRGTMKKLIRKLDLEVYFHEKTVVYGSRRDIVIFALKLPFVMIFAILLYPFYILWGVWFGIKSFWGEFKNEIIESGMILLPIMGFITIYKLIAYKKVKRGGEDEQ